METSPSPHPDVNLSPPVYDQLVYTLTDLLPPPLDDSPDALRARNRAAIAKVASMLPVNANEADLAAQCIAARSQAEDILRLLRQNADDVALVIRLNARYASMVRTSLSVHGRLMRVQALRHKRDAIEATAKEDEWTLHIAEQSMLKVADPTPKPPEPTRPKVAPVTAPAPHGNPKTEKHVSENKTNSHIAAFETAMSGQPWNQGPKGLGQTGLRKRLRETTAQSGWAGGQLPASGRQNPGYALTI